MGSCSLLQGIFPTQGSNPGLPHCGRILYQLSHQGSPRILEWVPIPSAAGLPSPGLEPGSPALQANSLQAELPGNPLCMHEGTIAYMSMCMKLKLQYFGYLMWIADSLNEILTLEKFKAEGEEGDRGWDGSMPSHSLDMNFGKLCDDEGQRGLVCCSPWGLEDMDVTWWLNINSMSQYVSLFWILLLRLIHKWTLFNWFKEK